MTSKNTISGRKQTNKIEVIREVSEVDRSAKKILDEKKPKDGGPQYWPDIDRFCDVWYLYPW